MIRFVYDHRYNQEIINPRGSNRNRGVFFNMSISFYALVTVITIFPVYVPALMSVFLPSTVIESLYPEGAVMEAESSMVRLPR